jgi:hypothetical protein
MRKILKNTDRNVSPRHIANLNGLAHEMPATVHTHTQKYIHTYKLYTYIYLCRMYTVLHVQVPKGQVVIATGYSYIIITFILYRTVTFRIQINTQYIRTVCSGSLEALRETSLGSSLPSLSRWVLVCWPSLFYVQGPLPKQFLLF